MLKEETDNLRRDKNRLLTALD